jgi:putative two-component system response regulator
MSPDKGEAAVNVAREGQPDIILMDVMMPVMNGIEATRILKQDDRTKHIPVIMVTALDTREDRLQGIACGADDFLTKPIDVEELEVRLRNNLRNKEYYDFLINHKELLEKQVAARTAELRQGYIDTIRRLTLAAEYKDEETGCHIRRISLYVKELALACGVDRDFADVIFYAAPMHDIGKVAIPDHILLKNGPLDAGEWEIMKTHTSFGAKILQGAESPYLRMAEEIALNHHERWNGTGYPNRLAGESIPFAARIMNICDQYDALRAKRPYKPAFSHQKTFDILTVGDGRTMPEHFDPNVLAGFHRVATVMDDIFESHQDEKAEIS